MEDYATLLQRAKAAGIYTREVFDSLHAHFRATDSLGTAWSVGIDSHRWHCRVSGSWIPGQPPPDLQLEQEVMQMLEDLRQRLPPPQAPPEPERPCPRCSKPIRLDARFCSHCGAGAEQTPGLRCPRCGEPVPSGAVFCDRCGTQVHAAPQPTAPQPPPPPQPPEPRCSRCGRPARPGLRFCTSCGGPVIGG